MRWNFILPGRARPKGSLRPIRTQAGGVYMADVKEDWTGESRAYLRRAWDKPLLAVPVELNIIFAYKRPKKSKYKAWPIKAGDLDKVLRRCLDMLQGVVLENDAWVVQVRAQKVWATKDYVDLTIHEIITPDDDLG